MAGLEDVIRRRQRKGVGQRLPRDNRPRTFEAFAVPAAEDVHGDWQLVPAHLRLAGHVVRVHINQLHDPVSVRAARRRDEMHGGRAADAYRIRERCRDVRQHVGTIDDEALIGNEPSAPGVGVAEPGGARHVRHRLARIGHVFVVRRR